MNHNTLAAEIHQENIDRGWWEQRKVLDIEASGFLSAGMPERYTTMTIPRNIGELLCLCHSEISEAWYGHATSKLDDHLPAYPMWWVELADASIRAYDILGYYSSPVVTFIDPDILEFPDPLFGSFNSAICALHLLVSNAMEGFRKGNIVSGKMHLWALLNTIQDLAVQNNIPLMRILNEKREYNGKRADHQLAARAAEGGKKF